MTVNFTPQAILNGMRKFCYKICDSAQSVFLSGFRHPDIKYDIFTRLSKDSGKPVKKVFIERVRGKITEVLHTDMQGYTTKVFRFNGNGKVYRISKIDLLTHKIINKTPIYKKYI